MDGIGASRLKLDMVARLGPGLAPPMLKWTLWPPSLTSCSPKGSCDKILTPEKSQVNLSSGRFLKHQITQNRVFLFCRVITKIRGIDGKSP
jgi:hypothetical protein